MKKNLQYRLLFILAIFVACGLIIYHPAEKINLGLDLRGGIHMVVQVNVEEALNAELEQMRERLELELREANVSFVQARVTPNREIEILSISPDQQGAAQELLRNYSETWGFQFRSIDGELGAVVGMTPSYRRFLGDQSVRQARQVIENRIDQYGVAEPSISIYGSGEVQDQIIIELPGVDDPGRVRDLIVTTARLDLKLVHPSMGGPFPSRESAIQAFNGALPQEYQVLPYRESPGDQLFLVVRRAAAVTGQQLRNARRSQDPYSGRPEVVFFLNPEGQRSFSRITGENVGNRLAIVLDNEVRSAPNIQDRITTDSARITGAFTVEQAEDLALTLRSGALPASLTILENRMVGPSLGMDSIRRGIMACIVGFALVIIGMIVLFRLSGVNAIVCLVFNLVVLMGALAYFQATLTLPGIAGIILTIGMAVDANILIFERVKEELRLGKTVRSAIDAGFSKVFSTIIDTNITTLVAAAFLFQFGTGPVRGFAVTLAVGLLANIFAATFVSRTLFEILFRKRDVIKLSI